MPIPANQVTVAEILMMGNMAAGGGRVVPIDLVFHYRRTAVVIAASKTALDTIFQTTVVTPIAAALNVRFLQVRNRIRWMNDAQDPYQDFTHAAAGAVTGDSMSSIDAAFILLKTALRGKSYRGGKHLGPMSESDTTSGTEDVFNAAALARLATVSAALVLALVDATPNTWNPAVLSRVAPANYKVNPTSVVTNDIVSAAVNKRVGVMRHRRIVSAY